jgi:hypothetical protein
MTIAVKVLNDEIKKISETNSLLDMLLEFERVLDDRDIYTYKNWMKGEILEGPLFDRHYITVKLMYPEADMPDPAGAKRLFKLGCLVKYDKNTLRSPIKVKTPDDITMVPTPDGRMRTKAKTKDEPVWVVSVKMPRRYVDEFSTDTIETEEDSYVDTESLNAEQQAEVEQRQQGNEEEFGDNLAGGGDF